MKLKIFTVGLLLATSFLAESVKGQGNVAPEVCTQFLPGPDKAVGLKAAKWKPGSKLRVGFIGGDAYVQNKVRTYALEWTKHCNLKLVFVPAGKPADIRVAFVAGKGSKSLIGSDSQKYSIDLATGNVYASSTGPSMNFGWFNAQTDEANFRRTTLHEFGHAIGLLHEHQSPSGSISWKRERVYQDYLASDGWDRPTVDQNVFNRYAGNITQFTAYDRTSIMHYPIPVAHVENPAHAVGWNSSLSAGDIAFVGKTYPFTKPHRERQGDPPHGGAIGPR